MKPDSPARATLVVLGLFLGGLALGSFTGRAAVARANDPYADLDLFARVLTTIERDFLEEVPTQRLVEAAIRGMVAELDRQSRWMSANEYQELQDDTEGAIDGIGIEVRPAGETLEVTRVVPGSPALRDGLAPGDRILEVDGASVAGLTALELRERLEGPRGEATVLTILRPGWPAPQEVRTVRDRIHKPSVRGALLGDVAYLRLAQFQQGAANELQLELSRIVEERGGPVGGLILDLRDNPGGLLTEAVAVTDLFLDDGVIVSTRRRGSDTPDEVHTATPGGLPSNLRVVVLVNGGSASASEIVAAALQETGRGTLVGETTYGKGTVQQVYRGLTPESSALKLTVGRYYTPSGAPVATGEGRVPDHEVPSPTLPTTTQDLRATIEGLTLEDAHRTRLLALVSQLPDETPAPAPIRWDAPVAERLGEDAQLRRATEILAAAD